MVLERGILFVLEIRPQVLPRWHVQVIRFALHVQVVQICNRLTAAVLDGAANMIVIVLACKSMM